MLGPCNFVCRLTGGNRQVWVWVQLPITMITKSQQFVKASLDHTLLPILYPSQTVSPPPTLSFHSHSVCGGNPHDLLALGKAGSEGRRASRDGTKLQMLKCSYLLPAAHVPRAAGAGDGDMATSGIQHRVSRDHQASASRNRNDALHTAEPELPHHGWGCTGQCCSWLCQGGGGAAAFLEVAEWVTHHDEKHSVTPVLAHLKKGKHCFWLLRSHWLGKGTAFTNFPVGKVWIVHDLQRCLINIQCT